LNWGRLDDVGPWKLMIAGAIAGITASYMMNEFQSLWATAQDSLTPESEKDHDRGKSKGDDATVKVAEVFAEKTTGEVIPEEEKSAAGSVVHYTFGAALGAAYGLAASRTPVVTSGYGTFYGSAVWLVADEIAVPLAGLSASPISSPLTTHLNALAAHWIYGFTTDLVMRGIVKKLWT
jgi:putative membrane protein